MHRLDGDPPPAAAPQPRLVDPDEPVHDLPLVLLLDPHHADKLAELGGMA